MQLCRRHCALFDFYNIKKAVEKASLRKQYF